MKNFPSCSIFAFVIASSFLIHTASAEGDYRERRRPAVCDSLHLKCGDKPDAIWYYSISGEKYELVKVDGYESYSGSASTTGAASCGIKYDKWTSRDIEYIAVEGEINRTTGRYEPNEHTNVACRSISKEEFTNVKKTKSESMSRLKSQRLEEEKKAQSELERNRAF